MGIKDFEPVVSAALPDVVALVPKEPAARLGRSSTQSVAVPDHRFWITEGSVPAQVGFSGNGLVSAVEDGRRGALR